MVAFEAEPERGRFWIASPAALVGLKEAADGRTRFSGEPVDRDFSDVALMLDRRSVSNGRQTRLRPAQAASSTPAARVRRR